MKSIIFIAPPAAGKGTLSDLITAKYKVPHIAVGNIFREKALENTEEALYIKKVMESGTLIEDNLTNKLLKERLSKDDTKNGYILDGYPRTINQAKELDKIIKELGYEPGVTIFLDIDEDEALKRSLGRIICPKCHKVYNKYKLEMQPKEAGKCDVCGSVLTLRTDDNEESFKRRFETYINETQPLLQYYRDKKMLHIIKVTDNPDDTLLKIEEIINGGK